jgi:hypothetical protein
MDLMIVFSGPHRLEVKPPTTMARAFEALSIAVRAWLRASAKGGPGLADSRA